MNTPLTTALAKLNIPSGKVIRYSSIANALGYVPKKIVKGKETTQPLKAGGQKYKEAVANEVIRRYNAVLQAEEEAKKALKPKRGRPKKVQNVVIKKQPVLKSKKLEEELKQKFYKKYKYVYENNESVADLYNAIKKEADAGDNGYVSIAYRDKNKNIIYWRSIRDGYLDSLEDFTEEFNKINEGVYGSDAIDTNDYIPDYNLFTIGSVNIAQSGKSDLMLYNVKGIESKEGLCGYLSLKECGYEAEKYKVKPASLKYFDNLSSLILKNELPIAIIANSFTIKKKASEMITEDNKKKLIVNDKKRDRQYIVCDMKQSDMDIVYLVGDDKAKHFLVYDEISQHIDYCVGKPTLSKDVMISRCNNVFKGNQLVFTPKQMNINSRKEELVPIEYLFFDYETVIDFNMSSCMKPYSLSILQLQPYDLIALEEADVKARGSNQNEEEKEEAKKTIEKIRQDKCITFLGYDCGERFIDWFLENSMNKMFVFIGFNNTNFDNFLMLEDFLKYRQTHSDREISVGDVFYNGSQLLNFRINGTHNFFDIRKHLVGSLKANCKAFKIESCAKKDFNHNYAQELYDDGKLIDYITGNDELKTYNEYDVLATAVLYRRYVNALATIPATEKYSRELHSIKTIGSLVYKVFGDNKQKLGFKLPKLEFNQYDDLQKSKIAGRVEMFNGVQKVNERLVSTDVCSLYPFVMSVLNVYYPTGDKLIEVDSYKGDDEIGFYYCDIDQSALKHLDLPNIYAKKNKIENDWGYEGKLENYLISNVMIGLLRKFNCDVVVKKGFIFPSKLKSCEMFGFLLDFMKAKNEQDTLKQNDDPAYNPALRETLKLLMNSLSGKVIEGLHTEKTIDIESAYEFLEVQKKATSINFINAIGGKMFLTYEIDAESICAKQQRPIYLGVLIYDYAKRYMYEMSYSKIGKSRLLYTDTDASKFRHSDFIKWKNWVDNANIQVPHHKEVEEIDPRYKDHKIFQYGSKVFGSFEDELEDAIGEEYVFYCLEKKSWLYGYTKNGKWKAKYRFKGLNGSAQLLSLEEPFIECRTIQHKATETKDAWNETKYSIKTESEYEVYKYYLEHTQNNIESGNEIKFFESVYTTGKAFVLCSSFRKIVKNSARNVEMEDESSFNKLMNKIQVNYNLKKIELKSITQSVDAVEDEEDDE